MPIQQNANLKSLNTLSIDAKAQYLALIENIEELKALLTIKDYQQMPKFILGEGSNILFTKDYSGLVIKIAIKGIQKIAENNDHVLIQAFAGENWHDFVLYCIEHGYAGVENLSLIPGTVGAAPVQNIGAYGAELSNVLFELTALRISDGSIRTFKNKECQFHYRDSIFKHLYKDRYVILSVILKLNKVPTFNIHYGNLKETLDNMQVKEITIKAVSDAVIHIRQSKLPDPNILSNAGSFFKNPIIRDTDFSNLQNIHHNIPHFLTDDASRIKISAAWLIEQCGFKGKRIGDIGIYEKQALILVNYGKGSSIEIQKFAEEIKQSVYKRFGILLEPEIVFV